MQYKNISRRAQLARRCINHTLRRSARYRGPEELIALKHREQILYWVTGRHATTLGCCWQGNHFFSLSSSLYSPFTLNHNSPAWCGAYPRCVHRNDRQGKETKPIPHLHGFNLWTDRPTPPTDENKLTDLHLPQKKTNWQTYISQIRKQTDRPTPLTEESKQLQIKTQNRTYLGLGDCRNTSVSL